MTLVELLVVIVLVTTLVTTVIPILSPGGDNKRLREASRNLNAYLQGAQARAIETGRPFGVAFQRLSADTERGADNAVCIRAEYVEVPPHYSGMDSSSLARICINDLQQITLQLVRYGNTTAPASDGLPAGFDIDLIPDRFIRAGDHVVVGPREYVILPYLQSPPNFAPGVRYATAYSAGEVGHGYFAGSSPVPETPPPGVFRLQAVTESSISLPITHRIGNPGDNNRVTEVSPGVAMPADQSAFFATAPVPFKLIRQPVPAGGEPLEMPGSVAVDLQASVFTNGTRVFAPADNTFNSSTNEYQALSAPVMVLFSPQGNIERFYSGYVDQFGVPQSSNVTSTLALCVGRRELIPPKQTEGAAALPAPENFREPINLQRDILDRNLSETAAKAVMDQYNWLNLDSRWVLIGGQSGAVSTIATSGVYPGPLTATVTQQLAAAIANASTRTTAGGR
jgi:type II secretory pathway pseudopilin PulG